VSQPAVDHRVVFIADRVETFDKITIDNLDLEFTEREYFDELSASLGRVSRGVTHYEQPEQFVEHIAEHREDIVLSVWSGVLSRNRKALVPAICEAASIRYVGADAYTNVVCQDKSLAKVFCRELGIDVPSGHLIMNHADLALLELLRPPLIVKPNFEGGSIGISTDNLAQTHVAAASLCERLLRTFKHGVLAEEFVRGREICIVLSGCGDRVDFARAVEVVLHGATIEDRIWSFEIKKQGNIESDYCDVTSELVPDLLDKTFRLFRRLNKVDLIRVDGRLCDGRFYMIELSPDVYLGSHGAFAQAFTLNGYTYDDMVTHLLLNAAASQGSESASMTGTRDRTGSTLA
jgi:D-alanine-D-alanine ligase